MAQLNRGTPYQHYVIPGRRFQIADSRLQIFKSNPRDEVIWVQSEISNLQSEIVSPVTTLARMAGPLRDAEAREAL